MRYLSEFGHHPLWTPDGKGIIAHLKKEDGQDLVYLPADGSKPEILFENFIGIHSTYDRNMKRIITDGFNYPDKNEASVLMYYMDSGKYEVVCSGQQSNFSHKTGCHVHPQWSRDEKRILFNMADSGKPQVYELEL